MRLSASSPPRTRPAASALLALLVLALPVAAVSNGPPDRGDGASRISSRDSASEYWDLLARLDSGHRVFVRVLITNEGPGSRSAAAFGHVVMPDGRRVRFDNAKRNGDWELSPDGLRIHIASSILDQRASPAKFEYDSNQRGVKLHLWFEPDGALPRPESPGLAGYSVDLLDSDAPVRGTLWVKGMAAPIDVTGRLAATHTWMERSESELAARRIDFFSLGAETSLYVSEVTTPDGERSRWLVAERGGDVVYRSDRFELDLEPPSRGSDYPVPAALTLRSPEIEGSIRLGDVLVQDDPFDALPQPFRFLLSLKARPRRIWTDSPFEVTLKSGPGRSESILEGAGITNVTFANPLPPELSARRRRASGA